MSRAVSTGPGFCDPTKLTFNYPANTGQSFSFSEDGFYEVARYRFKGNGSNPTCITGIMVWAHGTYSLNANGSITMVPFGDGYQQIQDPCSAVSNFIETYNQTEYFQGWRIWQDQRDGPKLHLYQFDGAPVPPMYQVSVTPNMFPTQLLRNNTFVTTMHLRSLPEDEELERPTGGASSSHAGGLVAAATVVLAAFASLSL